MNIREAKHSDLDALVELNQDVQELHVGLRPSVFKPTRNHDMSSGLSAFISGDHFQTFIAEHDGSAIGYAIAEVRHQDENAFKLSRDYLLIHQIAVAPDHRRKGVATALLEHARDLARQEGIARLQIDVYSANHDARAFYASQGFDTFREMMERDITQPEDGQLSSESAPCASPDEVSS